MVNDDHTPLMDALRELIAEARKDGLFDPHASWNQRVGDIVANVVKLDWTQLQVLQDILYIMKVL